MKRHLRRQKPTIEQTDDPSSATREVPRELRGRRVLTQLSSAVTELREAGTEPSIVELSYEDEELLGYSAESLFGVAAVDALRAGPTEWRTFLRRWLQRMGLEVVFDADTTRVR